MVFHFNMPTTVFIDTLRDRAIKAGGNALLIDQIDSLYDLVDMQAAVDEANKEQERAENERDDLWEELHDLLKALPASDKKDKPLRASYRAALQALERHADEDCLKRQVAQLREEMLP